jgi:hypothetical protein
MKLIGGAMAVAALLASSAQAQDVADVKRLTLLTFSGPVQLPGKILPAGTYRFEMADINNAAHVVRVLNEDGTEVIGTFSTIPTTTTTRDISSQETLVMFAERPAGSPQAAKEWYYPGRSIGEEFVYPKSQAMEIAKANSTTVAAIDENNRIVRIDSTGAVADDRQAETTTARADVAPAPPVQQTPAVGTAGQSPAPAQAAPAPRPARTELPRTASQLGLIQVLTGLSLVGALGVRRLIRRRI